MDLLWVLEGWGLYWVADPISIAVSTLRGGEGQLERRMIGWQILDPAYVFV